jgi:hypothetical protein
MASIIKDHLTKINDLEILNQEQEVIIQKLKFEKS